MGGGDAPVPVDEVGGRQGFDAAILIGGLIVADNHAVVDVELFQERLDDGPPFVIFGDAEHGEALILLTLFELGEPGNLDLAGAAPGGPEIEHHDLAAVIAEVDDAAVDVLQGEIRGGFAAGIAFERAAGADRFGGAGGPSQKRRRDQRRTSEPGYFREPGIV